MTFLHFCSLIFTLKSYVRFQLRYVLARISGINIYPKKSIQTNSSWLLFCEATGPLVVKKNGWPTAKSDQVKFQVFRVANVSYCFAMDSQTHNPALTVNTELGKMGEVIQQKLEMGEDVGIFKPLLVIQVRKDYSDGFVARISKPRFKNIYPQKNIW